MTIPFQLFGDQVDAGMFGPQPVAPPPPPPSPSLGQRLAALVGGQPSQALSAEQNAQAQKQAFQQAGLMALMAAGRGESTLSGLAQALMAGRETGGAARAQIQQAQMRRQLANQAQQADQAGLMQLFSEAVAAGDMEVAKQAVELIKNLQRGAPADKFEFRTLGRQLVRVNPVTGEAEVALEGAEEPRDFKLGAPREVVERGTGRRLLATFDGATGRFRDVNTGAIVDALPVPDAPFRRVDPAQQAVIAPAREALGVLREYEQSPGFVSKVLATGKAADVTRGLVSTDTQRFFAASGQLAALVTRLISGAQASEKEVERLQKAFIPQPGERPTVVSRKLDLFQKWVDAIEQGKEPWTAALETEGKSPAEIQRIMAERRAAGVAPPGNRFGDLIPGER